MRSSRRVGHGSRGHRLALAVGLGVVSVALAACGSSSSGSGAAASTSLAAGSAATTPVTLKLGYFNNITHGTAIVGLQEGLFAKALGPSVKLETSTFNAGGDATTALFSGAVDATYIGPSPTLNGWQKSKGAGLKIVSGAASGGAALVVKASITSPTQLKGTKLATPQLGNTQDVALRYWLKTQGFTTTTTGGGDVQILPQDNATAVTAFASGAIDGGWLPEPYASKLVAEGGHVLVNEKSLWPNGEFVTTQLIVSQTFLAAHPDVVANLVKGSLAANAWVNANSDKAKTVVNTYLTSLGKGLKPANLDAAWAQLTFTDDPIASSLKGNLDHGVAVGLLKPMNLTGIYDLAPLNAALKAEGKSAVQGL